MDHKEAFSYRYRFGSAEFDEADAPALLVRLCQTVTGDPAPSWGLTDAQCLALCQRCAGSSSSPNG